jgi:RNA polymerase sigma factor (sigma-70 family)
MSESELLAERFEEHRSHLRAVAHRMLGSFAEADDAVQEAWIRLSRSDTTEVENLGGWLTTVAARVCLNMLRARTTRREDALDAHVPDPVVSRHEHSGPEDEAMLADSVGVALLVVLEMLPPPERLAFGLHDLFGVSFDEIATIVDRSRRASSLAAPVGGRAAPSRCPTLTSTGSGESSTRSSPLLGSVTSKACWPCSTPTSCYAPTSAHPPRQPSSEARRLSPAAP